ncbi:hypothetical protein C4D60_Mb02t15550 [Musa balbisiana]|uniref:Uncharacterized protein n=1 Tax=Musa balbisiana TaxID=52838 RepID=A0A4S8IBT8_MUSBA|nr:hypothetical protein C4D60_Mb02t15550 [Musa balbisiana]
MPAAAPARNLSKFCLETIAATAPAQRCLVVFIAPAPTPCTLPFIFSFLILFFSCSSKTTVTPSSFPSHAASSDLLTSFPRNPADSRTKASLRFSDRKQSPTAPLHMILPKGAGFPQERHNLTGIVTAESGTQGSRKRRPPSAKRGGTSRSSGRRMRGRMTAWKRTSMPGIATRGRTDGRSYRVQNVFLGKGSRFGEGRKRGDMGVWREM